MAKKRKGMGGRGTTVALLVFFFILGAFAAVVVDRHLSGRAGRPPAVPADTAPGPPLPAPPSPTPTPPRAAYRIAVVIDDMGGDMGKLERILDIGSPVTVAVLPHLRHSRDVAERAHLEGYEVMLHLPMEPMDSAVNRPGQGALTTGMSGAEIRSVIDFDMASVPHAIGVNNHMGSRFTEDEALMREALTVVGERGFFFVDSKTSRRSVGLRVARELGLRAAERNVFLDNERDRDYIRGQFDKTLRIARKRGRAVAIGHPYPETLDVLKEKAEELRARGDVELVWMSDLIE